VGAKAEGLFALARKFGAKSSPKDERVSRLCGDVVVKLSSKTNATARKLSIMRQPRLEGLSLSKIFAKKEIHFPLGAKFSSMTRKPASRPLSQSPSNQPEKHLPLGGAFAFHWIPT